MTETISFVDSHENLISSFQIVFFISSFANYLKVQSLTGSVLSLSFFLWLTNTYNEIQVILATIAGLGLGFILATLFEIPQKKEFSDYIYYHAVQPFILISRRISLFLILKYTVNLFQAIKNSS